MPIPSEAGKLLREFCLGFRKVKLEQIQGAIATPLHHYLKTRTRTKRLKTYNAPKAFKVAISASVSPIAPAIFMPS